MLQKILKKDFNSTFLLTDSYKSQAEIITEYGQQLKISSNQAYQDTLLNILYEQYTILFEIRKTMITQGLKLPNPADNQMIQTVKEKYQQTNISKKP